VYALPSSGYRFARGNAPSSSVKVRVANYSVAPAYDVNVALLDWDWKRDPKPLGGIVVAVLSAQSTTDEFELNATSLKPPQSGFESAPVCVTFVDAEGVKWRRLPNGALERSTRFGRWRRER
jgi:hypothetical protein